MGVEGAGAAEGGGEEGFCEAIGLKRWALMYGLGSGLMGGGGFGDLLVGGGCSVVL